MYSTCIHCNRIFPANEVVEHFPVGRKLAFDAAKGRLWVVCGRCARWNLSPFETRWEAVEECERLYRDARLRVATENIGLARLADGTELVRIGAPLLPEFAAWRYGERLRLRRRDYVVGTAKLAVASAVTTLGTGVVMGAGGLAAVLIAMDLGQRIWGVSRPAEFRENAVVARVFGAEGEALTVRGWHLPQLLVRASEAGSNAWELHLMHDGGTASLAGAPATHALGQVLSRVNHSGGSRRLIRAAVERLASDGGTARYLVAAPRALRMIGGSGRLVQQPFEIRLALEMAANEEAERAAMEGELALLRSAWRQAEEIAAIADRLAVAPGPDAG